MATPLFIIKIVFDYFGIPLFYQSARIRKREIVLARQVSMYFIRENTKLSYAEIGENFRLDHATVIHSLRAVNNLNDTDKCFRNDLITIANKIMTKLNGESQILEWILKNFNTDTV